MRRPVQLNEEIQEALANSLARHLEMPDAMVTVLNVKCSANQLNATVGISVLPEGMSGTALERLRRLNSTLADDLKKRLRLRHIPRLRWTIDPVERRAVEYGEAVKSLDLWDS